MFELIRWPDFSFGDGLMILAGLANIWLMAGWIALYFQSRIAREISATCGCAGVVIALSLWTQMQGGVYVGYWLWCVAFALTATGMLLSIESLKRDQP